MTKRVGNMDFKEFKRLYVSYPRKNKDSGLIEFNSGISWLDKKFNALQITEEEYVAYKAKFTPELSEYHANRKRLTEDLQNKDSTYFAEIPQEQKLDYLEAIAEQNWQGDYIKGLYENKTFTNNLKACLFGVKPSDDMLKEERYKMGRFINFLKFSGIKEKIVDDGQGLGEKWQSLGEDEKIGVVNDFVRAYTRIYGIDDVNEIVFRDGKEMTYSCCYREGKIFMDRNLLSGDRIESQFLFPVLFHELTHHQQACLWCNDSEKYRIFNPLFNKFKASTSLYNRKDNDEIYFLMPTEMHAYWSQREFEQKASEELFNHKSLKRSRLDAGMYAALLAYHRNESR